MSIRYPQISDVSDRRSGYPGLSCVSLKHDAAVRLHPHYPTDVWTRFLPDSGYWINSQTERAISNLQAQCQPAESNGIDRKPVDIPPSNSRASTDCRGLSAA